MRHIIRADTATAATWLDPVQDRDYLAELGRYGSALRLDGSVGAGEAGLARAAADAA